MSRIIVVFVLLLSGFAAYSAAAQDKKPRVHTWSGKGVRLEMSALSSEQVHGFFIGRGFSAQDAGLVAQTGCVFRSSIGHAGLSAKDKPITIALKDWRVIPHEAGNTVPQKLKTRADWNKLWSQKNLPDSQKIAFHWALFPTKQRYFATDYNWGFLTFALAPGSQFDLDVIWQQDGKRQTHRLKNLECAQ